MQTLSVKYSESVTTPVNQVNISVIIDTKFNFLKALWYVHTTRHRLRQRHR